MVSGVSIQSALIAGSPPISLSLIVGESKWDAKASGTHRGFFFFPREAYIIVVFVHTQTECLVCHVIFYSGLPMIWMGNLVFVFCFSLA